MTADEAVFVARLMDYAPDGAAHEIAVGYLLASHRLGHHRVDPVPAGEFVGYDLALQPVHWRLRAGHRLRVSLSSGDVPALLPVAPPGTVTVACGEEGTVLRIHARRV